MTKLKLKKLIEEDYDKQVCAISRCNQLSMIIDGTRRLSGVDVPLCEEHWKIRTELPFKPCTRDKT